MGNNRVEISEVSEFANRYLKGRLPELIRTFPDVQELRTPGAFMGAADEVGNLEYSIARLQLAKAVVPDLKKASRLLLSDIIARVKVGKNLRTCSEVVTLISSTSLIGALVADQQLAAKVLAGITFVSAVLNVAVEYILNLNNPQLASARELLDEIVRNDARLSRIEADVDLALQFKIADQIEALVVQINAIFEFVNRVLLSMHGTAYESRIRAELSATSA